MQYYDSNVIAIDLEAGTIARPVAADLSASSGSSQVNQGVSLCGAGRYLYASE